MTIQKIKSEISSMKNKKVLAKIDIGRNKYEYIEGIVNGIYPFLFTIKTNSETKSFSYSDVLTKNVILKID
jgi:uncharacterized protein Veg